MRKEGIELAAVSPSTVVFPRILASMAALALLAACARDLDEPRAGDSSSITLTSGGAEPGHPPPVASLTLASGNVISFYEFEGQGTLVTEEGVAYTPPALNNPPELDSRQFVALWKALAPNTEVPQALVDLQARVDNEPAREPRGVRAHSPSVGGEPLDGPPPQNLDEGLLASPMGCDNGCCDYDWMYNTFQECRPNGDYSWMFLNYGWSYADITDIDLLFGYVCSAEGNSSWDINVSGNGGVYPVTQAHYLQIFWQACSWFWCGGGDLHDHVNTSTNQHLHTSCGFVMYD